MTRLLAYLLLAVAIWAAVFSRGGVYPQQWEWSALLISLGAAVWVQARPEVKPATGRPWVSMLLVALSCWLVLQLVPLPSALLRLLSPMRWSAVAAAREMTGQGNGGWAALSLAPGVTLQRLLDVIPAMAAFLAAREIGWRWKDHMWLALAQVIGIAWFESLLGLMQFFLAHGETGTVTGTYVNRNHFAGLLEMAFPLAAVAAVAAWRRSVRRPHSSAGSARGHGPQLFPSPAAEAQAAAAPQPAAYSWRWGAAGARQRPAVLAVSWLLMWIMAGCMLTGILLSLSRMGMISTLAGLLVMLGLWASSLKKTAFQWLRRLRWAIPAAIILFLLVSLPAQFILRFSETGVSQEGRLEIWRNTLPVVAAYPLTGTGIGCFERGLYRFKTAAPDQTVDYAHNDYLQLLAEMGVVGAGLAAALALWVLWQPFRVVMKWKPSHNRLPAIGLFAGLLTLVIHSFFDFNLYIPANALVFAWLAGLAASFAEPETTRLRVVVPATAFLIAAFSIFLDFGPVNVESWYCRAGLCRMDQVFTAPSAKGDVVADVAALMNEDPANPMVWSTYGELLTGHGQIPEAAEAFEHAVDLGPHISRILMRAASFNLGYSEPDRAFELANRLLRQSDAFDDPLFYSFMKSGVATADLLGAAIPPTRRAAHAWLSFLRSNGSEQDLLETWEWMRQNRLADQKSAAEIAWALWGKESFRSAQNLWAERRGGVQESYLNPERLVNLQFARPPDGSPFDWVMASMPSVEVSRHDGLEVRFTGKNVNFSGVRQFATVSPGVYRFSAEISSDGVTTDQGPFFHVFDAANPGRLDVGTPQVHGTVPRSWVTMDFKVPPGTEGIAVQLERTPSVRFENEIKGMVHVYKVSLVPVCEGSHCTGGETVVARLTQPTPEAAPPPESKPLPAAAAVRAPLPRFQGKQNSEISFDAATGQVTIRMLLRDPEGSFIPRIRRDNFAVYENGVRQQDAAIEIEHPPVAVAALIEWGGRYRTFGAALAQVLPQTLRQLVDEIGRQDSLAVFRYGDRFEQLSDLSSNRDALGRLIQGLGRPEFSELNFYDALRSTIEFMKKPRGSKAVVALSSGVDTFSHARYEDALSAAASGGIPVYMIDIAPLLRQYLGPADAGAITRIDWNRAESGLREIARASGGRFYTASSALNLSGVYDDVMENLRVRYLITYKSSTRGDLAAARSVRIVLADPKTGEPAGGKAARSNVLVESSYIPRSAPAAQQVRP
jgi:VWFA-related protein